MAASGCRDLYARKDTGEPEYLAIGHARAHPFFDEKEYTLSNLAANGLDMICGGTIKVAFIPVG